MRTVLVALGCGLLAGVALGAIGPVGLGLQRDLHLTLEMAGWAASAITAAPAALGLAAGWWIRRLGPRWALVLGLVVLASAGGVAALAPNGAVLLAGRLAQGAGYVLVVVAAPIAIARATGGATRRLALAIWTTVIPAGLAVASAGGGMVLALAGWRAWLGLAAAAALLLVAPAVAVADGRVQAGASPRAAALGRPLLLGSGFGAVALVGLAVVVALPTYLAATRGLGSAAAGAATSLVPLSSIAGSLVAGWLLRRGARLRTLVPAGLVIPAAAFAAFWPVLPASANVAAGMAVLLVNGVLIAAIFASVPDVVADPRDIDVANGAITQLGSLGNLVGPPVLAAVVAAGGWSAVGVAALPATAAAVVLLLAASAGVSPAGRASPRPRSAPTRPPGPP